MEDKKMDGTNITRDMLYRISLRCSGKIHSMRVGDSDVRRLAQASEGGPIEYTHCVFAYDGLLWAQKIQDNYNKLIERDEKLRSQYFFRGLEEPIQIILAPQKKKLSIENIGSMPQTDQVSKIEKTIAAWVRSEYDCEKDPAFKCCMLLAENNKTMLIVSYDEHVIGEKHMHRIIEGIMDGSSAGRSEPKYTSLKSRAKQISEELRRQSINYFTIKASGDIHNIWMPYERKSGVDVGTKSSAYYPLDSGLENSVRMFAAQNDVSIASVFMLAQAQIIKGLTGKQAFCLAMISDGSIGSYPVRVDFSKDSLEIMKGIDEDLAGAKDKKGCQIEDLEEAFKIDYDEVFHVACGIIDINENGMFDYSLPVSSSKLHFAMEIRYHIFTGELGIGYRYYVSSFTDEAVDAINTLMADILQRITAGVDASFDKSKYISEYDTDEEKLQKATVAKYGRILKDSGLFDLRNNAELMELAAKCSEQRFMENDKLIEEKISSTRIGFISDGMVEEYKLGKDGRPRSMKIMKKNEAIGIEALLDDTLSDCTYAVASNSASVIWIERDILIDFLNSYPDSWRAFVEYSQSRLKAMRVLWTRV